MFKKKHLSGNDYVAIAANLVPVFGVWFAGWSAKDAFIAYALETLIIGAFTIIKLAIATGYRGKDTWHADGKASQVSGLFFIFFFIVHFGMFTVIQMSLFAAAANFGHSNGFFDFVLHWYNYIDKETGIMLGSFAVSCLVRELYPFVAKKEYKESSMMLLMFQPYGRIFIQQVIVIMGSMVLVFGFDKVFIVVFAAVKIYFEVFVNFSKVLNRSLSEMEKPSK